MMASGLDGTALRWLLTVAFAVGMLWSLLPPGMNFDPVAREAASVPGEGGGLFAVQWVPLILLSLAIIALRFRWFTLMVRHINIWFVALLGWAFFSMLWAPDAFTVFKQATGISGVTLLGIAFGLAAWQPKRFSAVLLPWVIFLLVLSFVVALLLPDIGVHSSRQFELQGSWRGITYQKNGLGQLASFGAILCFHAWCARQGRPLWMLLGTLFSLLLIMLSRSSTSLLLALIVCGVIYLRLRAPLQLGVHSTRVKALLWLMVLAPLFIYMVLIGSLDSTALAQAFGEIFGKDATFSGRTYIWAELLRNIREHPWVGVGFNSFWPTSLSAATVSRLGWDCPNGHNGYLDLINDLGLIGFSLFVLLIWRHFRDVARLARFDHAQAVLHGAIVLYVMLANLTESGWFVPGSFTHVIAGYSSVMVSRLLFEAELQTVRAASASPVVSGYPSTASVR